MVAIMLGADNGFFYAGQVMHFSCPFTVFLIYHKHQLWVGATNFNTGMYFGVPDDFEYKDSYKFDRYRDGKKVNRVPSICWFTNLDHGRRHQPLQLMSMADNIRYSKHKEIRGNQYYRDASV